MSIRRRWRAGTRPGRRVRLRIPALDACEARILLDGSPTLSAVGFTVSRPTSGTTTADFQVDLNPPNLEEPVTVQYQIVSGTAVQGVDYEQTVSSGELLYEPDETLMDVPVTVLGTTQDRGPRTLSIILSDPTNAVIGANGGQATGTIVQTESGGVIAFSSSTYAAPASGTAETETITVDRSVATGLQAAGGVTVQYTTGGGTAVAGVDYTPTTGTLTFGPGQLSQTFTIPILPNLLTKTDSTIGLALYDPTGGGTLGQPDAATLTINRPNPLIVTNTLDAGLGSLRQAILASNAIPGADTITFAIPGPGPFTIAPGSPLPAIADTAVIDARTEPGYAGTPLVQLDGSAITGPSDGLDVLSAGSAILGLGISDFGGSGIVLASDHETVQADRIGTDITGLQALGNGLDGIYISGGSGDLIGGSGPGQGDLISGNGNVGVEVSGPSASAEAIQGDLIGTDAAGLHALGNARGGVFLDGAASDTIGGSSVAALDLISGNGGAGVVASGASASGNLIAGDLIGTDLTGEDRLGNGADGVYFEGAPGNRVVGSIISSNGLVGVRISGAGSTGDAVLGDRIGTDGAGTQALGNLDGGVFVVGAPGNSIGDGTAAGGDLISGNGGSGVEIYESTATGNAIRGDLIGTDAAGTARLGNALDGVFINVAGGNVVGGTAGAGNVISANGQVGVQILGASGNVVVGNMIGTTAAGVPTLGNAFGLFINGAPGNVVAPNLIAGNGVNNASQGGGGSDPVVLSTAAETSGGLVTAVSIRFSEPMNEARATDPRDYALRTVSATGAVGGTIPFTASYDSGSLTTTLTLASPLPARTQLLLAILAGPTLGLTSTSDVFLDGDLNGRPGGNFMGIVGATTTASRR